MNEKGERITENTLRRRLYGWVHKSGLKKQNLMPHDLRRTFGTWYLQANPGHIRELSGLMGHSDLSQVMNLEAPDRVLRHGRDVARTIAVLDIDRPTAGMTPQSSTATRSHERPREADPLLL